MKTTRLRVMIVENEPAHAEAIRDALKGSGTVWDIQVTGSLKEFHERVAAGTPDIVLMDLGLPDGHAADVLTAPPEDGPFPVLIMAGYGDEKTAVKAMKSGALDYIVKSPEVFAETPRILVRALREWTLLKKAKRKDEELRQSEERYRTITENMSDTVWVMDLDFTTTYVSPSILPARGFTLAELQALPFDKHMTPESFKTVSRALAEEMTPERLANKDLAISRQLELELYRKDGSTFWEDIVMTVVRDAAGRPKEIIAVGRDVSEKRRLEIALMKAAEEWRTAFDSITDLILNIDSDYRITRVNRAFAELVKTSPKDLVGGLCYEVIHGTKKPPPFCPHRKVFETKQSIEEEIFEPHLGIHLHIAVSPIIDSKGNVVGSVHVMKDITDRKRTEEELRERERQLSAVTDNLPGTVAQVDRKLRYLFVNAQYERWHGNKKESILGRTIPEVIGEEAFRRFKPYIEEALAGQRVIFEGSMEVSSGETLYGQVTYVPDVGSDGKVKGFFIVVNDITGRKRAEETLRKSEERYRLLFENATIGIFHSLPEGKYLRVNPALARMIGFDSPEEMVSSISDIGSEVYVNSHQRSAFLKEAIEKGDWVSIEGQFRHRDGHILTARQWAHPVLNPDGTVKYIEGFAEDITERTKVETRLTQSESLLNSTQRLAKIGGWEWNVDDQTMFWTDEVYRIHGVSPDEIAPGLKEHVGRSIECYDPEDRPVILAAFNRCIEEGMSYDMEFPFTTYQGKRIWIRTTGRAVVEGDKIVRVIGTIMDITESKWAEQTLRESEQKHRTILHTMEDGYFEVDLSGSFTSFNESMRQMLGYKREEMVGLNYRQYMAEEIAEKVFLTFNEVFRTGIPAKTVDWLLTRKDGTTIDVETSISLKRDNSGEPTGFFGIARDITDRRRIEEALRESEVRYVDLYENAPDMFISVDSKTGNIIACNNTLAGATGYSKEEIIGRPVFGMYQPDCAEYVKSTLFPRFRKTGEIRDEELKVLRKDGTVINVTLNTTAVRDEAGNILSSRSIWRDITDRRRIEEALKESEAHYRLLFEQAPDFLYLLDENGRILDCNTGALYKAPKKDLIGKSMAEFLTGESLESFARNVSVLQKGKIVEDELKFKRIDDTIIDVWYKAVPIKTGNHAISGILVYGRDVTDRKAVENAIRDWKERYELVVAASGQVAYDYHAVTGEILWGSTMERVLGYSPDEYAGGLGQWLEWLCPDDKEETLKYLAEAKEACAYWDAWYRLRHKDGHYVWIRDRGFFIPDEKGKAVRQLGMLEDITERKLAEEALQESEERFRGIAEIVPEAFFIYSLESNRYEYISPAFEVLFGRSVTEHYENPQLWYEAVHPDDRDRVAADIFESLDGGFAVDFRIIQPDGSIRWVFSRALPVKDERGNIVRLIGVNQDITERKAAAEAIGESERRYRLLAENASDIIFIIDMDLRFSYVSPSVARVRGFTVEEAMAQSPAESMTSDSLTVAMNAIKEELEIEARQSKDLTRTRILELEETCKDGSTIWTETTFSGLRDEQGTLVGFLGITRDITDRKAVEGALRESEERFRISSKSVSDLIWDWNIQESTLGWFGNIDEMLGYGPGKFPRTLEAWEKAIHPEDRTRVMAALERHLKKMVPYHEEYRVLRRDGTLCYWTDRGSAILDENGKAYRMVGACSDITERKLAEDNMLEANQLLFERTIELRKSEEQYRSLVENINDVLFNIDVNGTITYISPVAKSITGYSTDEYEGKNFAEFVHPEDIPELISSFKKSFEGVMENSEFRTITKDGSYLYVRSSSNPTIEDGVVVGLTGVLVDITERRRAEEQMIESEERYRELVENIEDIVYVTDGTGKIVFLNTAFERFSGYTQQEILRKNYMEMLTPESLKRIRELFKTQNKGQDIGVFEMSFFNKDREVRTIEVREKHIFEDGRLAEVHGLGRDITDRKAAQEALRVSEDKFRSLFQTSRDFISITDLEGRFVDTNEAAREFFGYSAEELSSISMLDLYVDPEDRNKIVDGILKSGYVTNLETKLRKKSGEIVDVTVSVNIRRDKDGNPVHFFSSARDMTEKRKMEQQLLQSEKLSAVGTMISGVAHELNKPLTSIIGNAQLLAKRDVPEDIKNKLSVILKESIRSSKIVAGLLAFAREHKPERKMTNINDILTETIKLREYDLKVSNIGVHVSLSDDLPQTFADPYQLQQVFINLVNNARDALAGRESAALAVRTYRRDDAVLIEFDDNGPGIAYESIKKIFDPFFTTKEVGKGTGLGLSMAYGIIKEHDGTILVESKPGQGAKFVVTLPIKEGELPAAKTVKPTVKPPRGARTVLVVEDEASLRDLLSEALTEGGFFVETASTGEEAISLVGMRKYDAVISDIKMPGIGGKELYLYIQKNHAEIADKIIFITGDILSKDTQSFLQITNNRFIEKPFNVDALIALVNDVLAG